ILLLLVSFHSSKPSDPSDIPGNVVINHLPNAGQYSKDDEISRLQFITENGKQEIIVRPEISIGNNVSNCANNGPCGSGGECIYHDAGLPTHRVVCQCYSGYRGRHCDESFRTKLMISFFFWGVFVFEVILIVIALCRSADESSYPLSTTARPLVFVLQERRL
ncbi:hypothetical protein PFISCL1PPCAC_10719, partial [Pristionchus fissidentatus]